MYIDGPSEKLCEWFQLVLFLKSLKMEERVLLVTQDKITKKAQGTNFEGEGRIPD